MGRHSMIACVVSVVLTSPAAAQHMEETTLVCRAERHDLAAPATNERSGDLIERRILRLASSAALAESACELHPRDVHRAPGVPDANQDRGLTPCDPGAECLPGCRDFRRLLDRRIEHSRRGYQVCNILDSTSTGRRRCLAARERANSLNGGLDYAAQRVIAHSACRERARRGQSPGACRRLIAAEEAGIPRAPGATVVAAVFARTVLGALIGEGEVLRAARRDDSVVLSKVDELTAANDLLMFYLLLGRDADRRDHVNRLAAGADPILRRHTEGVLVPEPALPPVGAANRCPDSHFCDEIHAVQLAARTCQDAEWYISPEGALRRNLDGSAGGICVDMSRFSLRRPLQYELRAPVRRAAEGHRTALQSMTGVLWPGETSDLPTRNATYGSLRLRAFPRGPTLNMLGHAEGVLTDDETPATLAHSAADLRDRRRTLAEGQRLGEAEANLVAYLRMRVPDLSVGAFAAARTDLDAAKSSLASLSAAEIGAFHTAYATVARELLLHAQVWLAIGASRTPRWVRHNAVRRVSNAIKVLPSPNDGETPLAYATRLLTGDPVARSLAAAQAAAATAIAANSDTTLVADERAHRRKLSRLCLLATSRHLASTHGLVIDPTAVVLDYDYESGFMGVAEDLEITEEDRVYVRVAGMPVQASIRVEVDDTGYAQTPRNIIGAQRATKNQASTDQQRDARRTVRPPEDWAFFGAGDRNFRLPGSEVISLGRLRGGRHYQLTVCETDNGSCTGARVLGDHWLPVHGPSYFGVRTGFGTTWLYSEQRVPVVVGQEGGNPVWEVGRQDIRSSFSFPVFFQWYVGGRDALDPLDVTFGIGLGIDANLRDKRFFPFGVFFDVGGVALGLSAVLELVDRPNVAPGRHLGAHSTAPNLETSFGQSAAWRPGLMVSLTFDADLFRIVFGNLFNTKLPQIGGVP